jgi:RNA polymerase sigma-70 factor (ECF subfamily)
VAGNEEDLLLVQRCTSGDVGAWRQFVDRFAGTVRAVARRYLKFHGAHADPADVDDVVQEVFLAVTRHDYRLLRNYDPTFTVKTYLGVIARTEVHRLLRRRRPAASDPAALDAAVEGPGGGDAAEAVGRAEETEILHRALDDLPERDALILKLRFLRECDYRTIAARMEIPEASVGQTLFRAKQRLLERLKRFLTILV